MKPKSDHPWRKWSLDKKRSAVEDDAGVQLDALDRSTQRWIGERGRRGSNPKRGKTEDRRDRE